MTTENQPKPATKLMSSAEFKAARHALGLNVEELGLMLDTNGKSIRCIEASENSNMWRPPAPRMVRLLEAYLAGYRPDDWPKDR